MRLLQVFQGKANGDEYACKLRRSLCSVKKAPRIWFEKPWKDLTGKGFETVRSYPCLLKLREKDLYLLICADGMLILGKYPEDSSNAKKVLGELYVVKDIGMAE